MLDKNLLQETLDEIIDPLALGKQIEELFNKRCAEFKKEVIGDHANAKTVADEMIKNLKITNEKEKEDILNFCMQKFSE